MVERAIFEEAGVVVDSRFVKFGSTAVKTSEIKQVHSSSYRTDGHTARVAWVVVSVMFVIWVVAPLQNAFMIPLLLAFGAFAYWKQTHPKPMRYRVIIGTGSTLGSNVLDMEDEDQASRLRSAIEAAMTGDSNSDARTDSPWGPRDKVGALSAAAVPQSQLGDTDPGGQGAVLTFPKSERATEVIDTPFQYVTCEDCEGEFPWGAEYCPHCGALPRRDVSRGLWWLLGVSATVMVLLAFSFGAPPRPSIDGRSQAATGKVSGTDEARLEHIVPPAVSDQPYYSSETERLNAMKAGAERSMSQSMKPEPTGTPGAEPMRWIVNLQFSGCPEAKDWFTFGEQIRAGRYDVELPERCFLLRPGAVILVPPKGAREVVEHHDHAYERAATEQGVVFWTDGMDNMSLTPL